MKTEIATDRTQSARLLRCEVSADTADMMFTPHNTLSTEPYKEVLKDRGYMPAWSLNALLGLIPHVIELDDDTECYFCLAKDYPASEDYSAAYLECWTLDHESIVRIRDNSPIEACVRLIEWLVENNYKLNEQ